MLLVSPQLTPSNMAWVPSVKYLYSCLQNTLSYGVEIREGVVNVSADMMYYPYSRWSFKYLSFENLFYVQSLLLVLQVEK